MLIQVKFVFIEFGSVWIWIRWSSDQINFGSNSFGSIWVQIGSKLVRVGFSYGFG